MSRFIDHEKIVDNSPLVISKKGVNIKKQEKAEEPTPSGLPLANLQNLFYVGIPERVYNKIQDLAKQHHRSIEEEMNFVFQKILEL